MRYLIVTRCEGIYEYIPLEQISFGFIETDDHEYRIEMTVGGGHTETLFEKKYIPDVDISMKYIISLPDGCMFDARELF